MKTRIILIGLSVWIQSCSHRPHYQVQIYGEDIPVQLVERASHLDSYLDGSGSRNERIEGLYDNFEIEKPKYSNFNQTPTEDESVLTEEQINHTSQSRGIQIRNILIQKLPLIIQCRDQYYQSKGIMVSGPLTIVFKVYPNGQVKRAGVAENDFPLPVKACIVERIYQIRFPSIKENISVKVHQPFRF